MVKDLYNENYKLLKNKRRNKKMAEPLKLMD
jgi:hypothetical protein